MAIFDRSSGVGVVACLPREVIVIATESLNAPAVGDLARVGHRVLVHFAADVQRQELDAVVRRVFGIALASEANVEGPVEGAAVVGPGGGVRGRLLRRMVRHLLYVL